MADLSFMGGFNAEDIDEPTDNSSPLPNGDYYLQLEDAEVRDTANGKGRGMNATFEVMGDAEGNHQGRKVFAWFNLQHENETAQKIGLAEFASLCRAVGNPQCGNTDELIGKPFVGRIGLDRKDKEKNVIKKYMTVDGNRPKEPAKATEPQQSTQPEQSDKPIWLQ